MKTLAFVLLCAFVCIACARPLKTLSDGQPGYVVTCDTLRERCIDEITRLCRDRNSIIVTERANEIRQEIRWASTGPYTPGWVFPSYNSRYWIEARCDPF